MAFMISEKEAQENVGNRLMRFEFKPKQTHERAIVKNITSFYFKCHRSFEVEFYKYFFYWNLINKCYTVSSKRAYKHFLRS